MLLDLSRNVARMERDIPDLLPSLHSATHLMIVTDYAGQHPNKSAKYELYSFLIYDFNAASKWNDERKAVRDHGLGIRTMSFKGLHDKVKLRALPQFAAAADHIPGVLVTVAVHKAHRSLFRIGQALDMQIDELRPYDHWQRISFEKLLRTVHFVSFFLGALSRDGQVVHWYSDEDDIAPNRSRQDRSRTDELAKVWLTVMPNYVPHRIPQVRIGTERDDEPGKSLSDVLALPDLACGAWCQLFSHATARDFGEGSSALKESLGSLTVPALRVLHWFALPGVALRRLLCVIDPPTPDAQVPHICSAPQLMRDFRTDIADELLKRESAG
jgi:hypothetical protein